MAPFPSLDAPVAGASAALESRDSGTNNPKRDVRGDFDRTHQPRAQALGGGTAVLMSEEDVTDDDMTNAMETLLDPGVTVTDMGGGYDRLIGLLDGRSECPADISGRDDIFEAFASLKNVEDVELVFQYDPDADQAVSATAAAALLRNEVEQGRCGSLRLIRLASLGMRYTATSLWFVVLLSVVAGVETVKGANYGKAGPQLGPKLEDAKEKYVAQHGPAHDESKAAAEKTADTIEKFGAFQRVKN
ncbi:hypothetical protein DFJ73DRAFT_794293 [Zopfochytrium polystomum]|nr:hypothetical protein DFJ73DRAFT_794293 [Zopfochytrium polystomum]